MRKTELRTPEAAVLHMVHKLTRPCQIVRVTLRRLSQLAPAISRYLPLWWDNFNGSSNQISIEMAQCPTRLQRSTRQSAAGSCAATALLELCILAPAHPPERECRMSRGCRQRAHGGMRERERCRAGRRREPRAECASARACLYCTPACECPCMSRDRHASVLCRLSAEVVSVRVSGWRRGSPPPCPPRVRDYYSTIPIGYNPTCTCT